MVRTVEIIISITISIVFLLNLTIMPDLVCTFCGTTDCTSEYCLKRHLAVCSKRYTAYDDDELVNKTLHTQKNSFPVLRLRVHPVGTRRKSHDDHDNFDGRSHFSLTCTNYNDNAKAFPYLTNVNCSKIGRLLQSGSKIDTTPWATGLPYYDFTTKHLTYHCRPPC